jgi:hypothetical protein
MYDYKWQSEVKYYYEVIFLHVIKMMLIDRANNQLYQETRIGQTDPQCTHHASKKIQKL